MKKILTIALAFWVVMTAGCAPVEVTPPGGMVTGVALDELDSGAQVIFSIPVANTGDPIGLDFRGSIYKGTMTAELTAPDGAVLWSAQTPAYGRFSHNTLVTATQTGTYTLGIVWTGPVQVVYDLTWQPGAVELPRLTAWAALPGVGVLLVVTGFLVYFARRKLSLRYLALGAIGWLAASSLKTAWAFGLNQQVADALRSSLPAWTSTSLNAVYIGLVTGLFEVVAVWLALRFTRFGQADWGEALAFGIGFAVVQPVIQAMDPFSLFIAALTNTDTLPMAAMQQIQYLNNPLYGFLPVWDWFFTILIQMAAMTALFYSVTGRRWFPFWLTFGGKVLFDAITAFTQVTGESSLPRLWAVRGITAIFGVLGFFALRWLARNYPDITGGKFSSLVKVDSGLEKRPASKR